MPRSRSYIPLTERLAAALSMLLPQEQRDDLRARKVLAFVVMKLFHNDHGALHAFGDEISSDLWWNLTPMLVAPHREKSKRDTAIVAKTKRIQKRVELFEYITSTKAGVVATNPVPRRKLKRAWPKRSLQSRNDLRKRKGRKIDDIIYP